MSSGLFLPGFASTAKLVAPTVTQGDIQRLGSGTTSATVTVGAASGGSGGYSYSAASIDRPGGSSAAVSGTVPSALSVTGVGNGESVTLSGTVTDSATDQVVEWSHTVAVAAAGGGAAWTDLVDLDFTDVTTAGALSGSTTLSFQSSGTTVASDWSTYSGGNGTCTPTNSTGLVIDGGSDTSSGNTLSLDIDPLLASYTVEDVRKYQYAVHVVITGISYPSAGNSSLFVGVNLGTNISHNSGKARMFFAEDAGDGTNEEIRVRKNTSSSAIQSTTAIKTSRVITLIMTGGELVEAQDTSGTTPPTPAPGANGTISIGSESGGLASTSPTYQANGLRLFVCSGDTSDLTITRVLIQRR